MLDRGEVDAVVNGYELTEARARDYLATRPYYVYQLQLMARRGGPVRSLGRLRPAPARRRPLAGRRAGRCRRPTPSPSGSTGGNVRVVRFDGATNAMMAVRNGQIDATLQDLPAARYYVRRPSSATPRPRRPARGVRLLRDVPPQGGRAASATRSTRAIGRLIASGELAGDLREVRHLERRPGGPRPTDADSPAGPAARAGRGSTSACSAGFRPACCWRP